MMCIPEPNFVRNPHKQHKNKTGYIIYKRTVKITTTNKGKNGRSRSRSFVWWTVDHFDLADPHPEHKWHSTGSVLMGRPIFDEDGEPIEGKKVTVDDKIYTPYISKKNKLAMQYINMWHMQNLSNEEGKLDITVDYWIYNTNKNREELIGNKSAPGELTKECELDFQKWLRQGLRSKWGPAAKKWCDKNNNGFYLGSLPEAYDANEYQHRCRLILHGFKDEKIRNSFFSKRKNQFVSKGTIKGELRWDLPEASKMPKTLSEQQLSARVSIYPVPKQEAPNLTRANMRFSKEWIYRGKLWGGYQVPKIEKINTK